jgi:NarL family two-component system response regulator LiaR
MSPALNPSDADLSPKPLKILIVEDDPVMRLGLEQFFENSPQFTVIGQAEDGYRAVEAAIKLNPDLVLMDIGLPYLDGIAATQQIKAKRPETRIIVFTSHTDNTEMIAALSSGADAYCVKGTRLEQLKVAIACAQDGGAYLDPQIAHHVIDYLKPAPPTVNSAQFSARELDVLRLIVEGKSNPEIAAALYLSLSTVKAHVRTIMNKLAVDDRIQAAVAALRSGLV